MQEEFPFLHLSQDPYRILGISSEASPGDIKKAYFELIKKFSPEKKPEAFKKIRAAYEQIRTNQRREQTDFLLFDEGDVAADFLEIKGPVYNVFEDILDMEIWNIMSETEGK